MKQFPIIILILLGAIGLAAYSSIFVVREDEQALVLQFGKHQRTVQVPGIQFKLPIVQDVQYFDKRVLDYDAVAAEVPTSDQKQLVVDAFARYRIINPLRFFEAVNSEVILEGQLNQIISGSLRDIFGEVPLAVMLTAERANLMVKIAEAVDKNSRHLGIEVIDVRIKRLDLPTENSQAIFRRMQTQREQEARGIRAEGDRQARTIRADADKQQRVILAAAKKDSEILRGQGDATATRLYNNAFGQDPDFFDFYRSLQAMRTGLSGSSTSYVGPPKGEFFRFFEGGAGKADQ